MTKILDQFGKPIDRVVLDEPQTARISALQNQYLTPMLGGLTPARLARTLLEADQGNLLDQHRLFADMEERDGHLRAEMDKRKNAIVGLSWDIVPPRNASAAEKAAAEWVREVLQDAVDPLEDLLLAMMDGVGHGFSSVEMEWRNEGGELLPSFHPRPQEWFRLDRSRTELRLMDATMDGIPLIPFGWVMHTHGKAKTGYMGRMGLYRTLVWPFLYKAYALGDFAELSRCPRFVFDLGDAVDLKTYADALPSLVNIGLKVPVAWAQEKLQIPQPKDGEAVLVPTKPEPLPPAAAALTLQLGTGTAALSAETPDPSEADADQLGAATAAIWTARIDAIKAMVDQATDLTALQRDLVAAFGGQPPEDLVKIMTAALALAEMKGMADVQDGR